MSPLSIWLIDFRWMYVVVGIGGLALLWRRPLPGAVVLLVTAGHLAAWGAYVAPLGRLYALDVNNDRSFNVAMAATVAAGNSPFEHVQVGQASLEPFWDLYVAGISLFEPRRVLDAYEWMAPLSIVAVALGLYFGLGGPGSMGAWERALVVFAVLGLSSWSLSLESPVLPFWSGNFLFKPNHAVALGVVGLVLLTQQCRSRWWISGLVLGLLAWTFVFAWLYVLIALVVATWIRPASDRQWAELAKVFGLSLLVVSPELANLLQDYAPFAPGGSPDQVWRNAAPLARSLGRPVWLIGDLGPLLLPAAAGAFVLSSRRSRQDSLLLGLLAAAWILWLASIPAAHRGYALGADEIHYYLRFSLALCAGCALASLARAAERGLVSTGGRSRLLVLAACWPLTFPAYFDPGEGDRFYLRSVAPIPEAARDYGRWVAIHTPGDAVFLAGPTAASWIGVLSGRRVLLAGRARPPADYESRKRAERAMLTSSDEDTVRRTAVRFGVDYLAVDTALTREYRDRRLPRLGGSGVYTLVFRNEEVAIWRVR